MVELYFGDPFVYAGCVYWTTRVTGQMVCGEALQPDPGKPIMVKVSRQDVRPVYRVQMPARYPEGHRKAGLEFFQR